MMNLRLTTVASTVLLLSACASYSIWDLHSAPASMHVDVSTNYKHAYQQVLEKMRTCVNAGYLAGFVEPRVKHALYEGAKKATVTVVNTNVWREHYLVHVSFSAIGQEKTQVDAYAAYPDWSPKVNAIKNWISDPQAKCSS